jgi:ABC-type glycerol-3-phosphate transport system substrate-binding protein
MSPGTSTSFYSRRDFLKLAGVFASGVVVGSVASYLGLAQRAPVTITPAVSGPSAPLTFAIGGFRPDIVIENVAEFDRQWLIPKDKKTRVEQLSGDLTVATQSRLAAGYPLDIVYAYPYATVTWSKAGWIMPIDNIKATDIVPYDIADAINEMYPIVEQAYSVDGRLYGLPYFLSSYGCILTNEELLDKAGMSGDYPSTWKEMYDYVEKLAKKSITEYPLLPSWYNEPFGIPWAFVLETINQGGNKALWEEKWPYYPTFDKGTLAEEVLKDWKRAWDNRWVPRAVLVMKQTDYLGEFATGKYFYNVNAEYYLGYFNDPSRSRIAKKTSIVPVKKQSWGILDSAIYALVNRKRSEIDLQYAQALLEFLGYKDRYGNYYVGKRWMLLEFLKTWPKIFNDPEVRIIWGARLYREKDLDTVNEILQKVMFPMAWKAAWYTKWNTIAQTELPLIFTGEKTIADVITTLRGQAEKLAKEEEESVATATKR